jgi:hypothetical protein
LRAAGFAPLREPGGLAVHCAEPEARIAEVVRALDVPGLTVAVRHPSMNDVYLAAAGPGDRLAARGGASAVRVPGEPGGPRGGEDVRREPYGVSRVPYEEQNIATDTCAQEEAAPR